VFKMELVVLNNTKQFPYKILKASWINVS
jgi:hypothetical protein